MIPTPHPIVVPILDPIVVPRPHPIVVPAPPTSTPQPSHQGPSPIVVHSSCRPSSSSNSSPDVAPTADAPDSVANDVDPPLHERPMIKLFNRG